MPAYEGLICSNLVHHLEHKTGDRFIHQWQVLRAIMAADPCGCGACLDAETSEEQIPTPADARERRIYHHAYWIGAQAGQQDVKAQYGHIMAPAPGN